MLKACTSLVSGVATQHGRHHRHRCTPTPQAQPQQLRWQQLHALSGLQLGRTLRSENSITSARTHRSVACRNSSSNSDGGTGVQNSVGAAAADAAKGAAARLVDFLNEAWTPFHAKQLKTEQLLAAGYEELLERDAWGERIAPGGKYFITRNMSSVVAFAVGKRDAVLDCPRYFHSM